MEPFWSLQVEKSFLYSSTRLAITPDVRAGYEMCVRLDVELCCDVVEKWASGVGTALAAAPERELPMQERPVQNANSIPQAGTE
jgi:hypothetical protein